MLHEIKSGLILNERSVTWKVLEANDLNLTERSTVTGKVTIRLTDRRKLAVIGTASGYHFIPRMNNITLRLLF
jgi:hypothetical protein